MALISCPECGKEKVSDTASNCPECGYPVKSHFDKIEIDRNQKALQVQKDKKKQAHLEQIKNKKEIRKKVWENNKIKIRNIILILTGITIIVLLGFLIIKGVNIYKYRLIGDDITQYQNAINEYNNTMNVLLEKKRFLNDDCIHFGGKNSYWRDEFDKSDFMVNKLQYKIYTILDEFETICFPQKYTDLYVRFIEVNKLYTTESMYITKKVYLWESPVSFEKQSALSDMLDKLTTELKNKYYVPDYMLIDEADTVITNYSEKQSFPYDKDSTATLEYRNGDVRYQGEILDGKPHGQGVLFYPRKYGAGVFFDGEFENGYRTNNGTVYKKINLQVENQSPFVGIWRCSFTDSVEDGAIILEITQKENMLYFQKTIYNYMVSEDIVTKKERTITGSSKIDSTDEIYAEFTDAKYILSGNTLYEWFLQNKSLNGPQNKYEKD